MHVLFRFLKRAKRRPKLLYQDVIKYIVERTYRVEAEKDWKRTIRRKAGDFVVKDGQLYTKGEDCQRRIQGGGGGGGGGGAEGAIAPPPPLFFRTRPFFILYHAPSGSRSA